jgi:PAS domain S-box-containing protein
MWRRTRQRRELPRYGIAFLSVGLALVFKLILDASFAGLGSSTLLLCIAAVMVSAWYGGQGPGLLATVLSAVIADYFFLEPIYSFFGSSWDTNINLCFFLLEGTLISLLGGALRRSEARKSAMFEAASDAIVTLDHEGRIVECNSAADSVFGRTRTELLGKELMQLIKPQQLGSSDSANLRDCLRTGDGPLLGNRMELPALRADGTEFPAEMVITRIGVVDPPVFVGFIRDISDRKRAEHELHAAKEASESANLAKSQFLANVSHETRTPLSVVIGMLDLSLRDELPPAVRDYLTTASDSADTLVLLINDILDFSQMESGRFQLASAEFSLRDTLDETIKLLSTRAHKKGLQLTCNVHPGVPDRVVGDARRLRQVLVNLGDNAIKFTEQGEVVVDVERTRDTEVTSGESQTAQGDNDARDGSNVTLHITVTDTGIGIARENQERIFASFTQADPSSTRRYSGTGLGLAICRELVGRMGGRVWVESELVRGSRFHCIVQLRLATAAAAKGVPAVKPPRPLRVLIVEDTPAHQKLVSAMLQKRGHMAIIAQNGREAIEMVSKNAFDVVLMDLQMPHMDGFQATAAIRSLNSTHSRVPVVAMTAHALREDRERCRAAGMDDYVGKPIDAARLVDTIERLAAAEAPDHSAADTPEGSAGAGTTTNASAPSPNARSIVDRDAALRRLNGDEKLFRDMIQFFDEDSPSLIETIRLCAKSGDSEALARAAHTLKGLAANFDAEAAVASAARLQQLAESYDASAFEPAIAELECELSRLTVALDPYRR